MAIYSKVSTPPQNGEIIGGCIDAHDPQTRHMQDAGALTGEATPFGHPERLSREGLGVPGVNRRHVFGALRISGAGDLWSVEPGRFL